jgi:hypothetical protein
VTARKVRLGTDGQGGGAGGIGANARAVPEARTPGELKRIRERAGKVDPVGYEVSQHQHVERVADLSDQAARRAARRRRQEGDDAPALRPDAAIRSLGIVQSIPTPYAGHELLDDEDEGVDLQADPDEQPETV